MTSELARRIAITIGALLIFRFGSYVPLPGISTQSGVFSSGAVTRVSIFALSLIPYLSAAIIIQLLSVVWGRLSGLERSGEAGRRKIARYTLILTLLLAAFQAFGIASAMQNIWALSPARRLCCRRSSDGQWRAFWSGSANKLPAAASTTGLRSSCSSASSFQCRRSRNCPEPLRQGALSIILLWWPSRGGHGGRDRSRRTHGGTCRCNMPRGGSDSALAAAFVDAADQLNSRVLIGHGNARIFYLPLA